MMLKFANDLQKEAESVWWRLSWKEPKLRQQSLFIRFIIISMWRSGFLERVQLLHIPVKKY